MGSETHGPVAPSAGLLRDLWRVLTRRQRRAVLWAQLLSIVMALSTVSGIALIAPFFAVLGDSRLIEQKGLVATLFRLFGSPPRHRFEAQLGLLFMGLVFASNLVNVVGTFVMSRLAYAIGTDLQSTLYGEYLHRSYAFHTRSHGAQLFNNVIQEADRVIKDVMLNAFSLVTNVATATLIVATVVWLNPALASAMIAALAGGYLLIYLLARNWLLRAGEKQATLLNEQAKTVHESLGAIKEILILRIQDYFHRSFEQTARAMGRLQANTLLVAQSPRNIMECVAVLGLVVIALMATGQQDTLGPALGQLTFLGFAAYRLLPTLQQAFACVVRIRAERGRFASIAPDLQRARARQPQVHTVEPSWLQRPRQSIDLRDVSYRYQPDRAAAVSAITLRIPARAAVGLVGPSGCGKTTLVDLICGLLVPMVGQIEIDGVVLSDRNRADWQTRIAYVPQNICLLDTSIACNVALGVASDRIDPQRLQRAARLAQLDEFVSTLPGGYEHPIGERGVRLSGGQRQRIGIARALYSESPVLILDEATNALDGMTEQELISTIMRLRGRHTIILIAHRLGSVRACDLIYEFEEGKVRCSGSYDQLLRDSATFRGLVSVP
jgi:ATP-binding cassette, subfamily B, bacterial PglK